LIATRIENLDYLFLIKIILFYLTYGQTTRAGPEEEQGRHRQGCFPEESRRQSTPASIQKWTKGKVKEKADNAVFLDQATYDRLITGIPKLGKHISTSTLIEKYKIVGSIARILLRRCVENGSIRAVESHSRQTLFTPIQVAEKAAPVAAETK
jgi:small subunit ribosomal protein S25e